MTSQDFNQMINLLKLGSYSDYCMFILEAYLTPNISKETKNFLLDQLQKFYIMQNNLLRTNLMEIKYYINKTRNENEITILNKLIKSIDNTLMSNLKILNEYKCISKL